MKPQDKIDLIQALNVTEFISQYPALKSSDIDNDENIEYREQIAKFVNILGLELVKCYEDCDLEVHCDATMRLIQQIFDPFISLLAEKDDDTSTAVFYYCSAYRA